jgi:hypothetical protein
MHSGRTILTLAATSLLLAVSPALAGTPKSSSSISLVMFSVSAIGTGPHWGNQVTFAVSTNATDRPYVLLNCYQNGKWVYAAQAGFYPSYPFAQRFTLASTAWTGGAADCTARLGALNAYGTKFRELASTSFHVSA